MDGDSQVIPDIPKGNVIFAVPKKGRLYEQCMKLLLGAGLDHIRPPRLDIAECKGLPVTLVFLPAHDIATYVGEGNVDLGITGYDVLQESGEGDNVETVMELGFGKCRLCVQAPVTSAIKDVSVLAGKRIVTSFPHLTKKFFDQFGDDKETKIKYVSGSVEAACGLGLADAVVDLVETGTTMKAAGLEVVAEVVASQTVLIANKSTPHRQLVERITRRIEGHITAERYLMISYNVSLENLSAAQAITPGKRSPTVTQLQEEGWYAVQALIEKKKSSDIMDQLSEVGATDILLFALQNSRM
ncbi:ATP phosphoribosyltransferase [Tribonema minus]|uniref:ATP phosphoribosyltransferase n=1 Tax=Tribonema minus TaxID=303371 RepID=A0A835Z6A7_9STRA|nr:ATP phosphoribosyltransferase [Tribonema minus]